MNISNPNISQKYLNNKKVTILISMSQAIEFFLWHDTEVLFTKYVHKYFTLSMLINNLDLKKWGR